MTVPVESATTVSILDTADLIRGVTYKRDEVRSSPADGYVPIVRASNIVDGALRFDDLVFVPASRVKESQKLRRGDIIVAMSSGSRKAVGKAALVNDDWEGAFGAFCGVLRAKAETDPLWLAQFMRSAMYRRAIGNLVAGTSINNLNKSVLASLRVPRVAFSQQCVQGRFLETSERLLESSTTHIEGGGRSIDLCKQAVLASACRGRLTAGWSERNRVTELEDALREIKISGRQTGRAATSAVIPGIAALSVGNPGSAAPKGWRWTPLSLVAKLESGHTPSRKHPEYWSDGSIPWITLQDARANHGGRIVNTREFTNDLGVANSAARVLPRGTVCLSRTASVGYVVIMDRPMTTSQDFVNWVCSDVLMPEFLMYCFLAEGRGIRRFGRGTTHTTIYFPEIKALHVCLPPPEEQEEICTQARTRLAALDEVVLQLEQAMESVDAIRQSLLTSAFSS